MEERFPAFLDNALKENPMKGEYFLPGVVDQLIKRRKGPGQGSQVSRPLVWCNLQGGQGQRSLGPSVDERQG